MVYGVWGLGRVLFGFPQITQWVFCGFRLGFHFSRSAALLANRPVMLDTRLVLGHLGIASVLVPAVVAQLKELVQHGFHCLALFL